mgnify:CR=1 FL=1
MAAALAAAAEAAGIASFNATVETAPKLRAATLAGYVVEIGGGDGERPVVAVESTRGLRKGVDVVLAASDGWPRRAYAVAVDARVVARVDGQQRRRPRPTPVHQHRRGGGWLRRRAQLRPEVLRACGGREEERGGR